ncbi:MAG: hypothetical protein AAFZ38_08340 [Myxococcota bacterium]
MNTGTVVLSLVLAQAGPGGDQYREAPPTDTTPRVLRDAPPPQTRSDETPPSLTHNPTPAATKRPAPRRQSGGAHAVTIYSDDAGHKLQVDGQDFFVFGMNWGYVPVGTNYNYSLWNQPDAFIRNALDYEMTLLKDMGVNTVRQYTGIPKRWIEYIHDKYGIYTMLNHAMGRYGFEVDGVYRAPTNYQDERTRAAIKEDVYALVENYKDTRGLLFWLLGNENNYGLEWNSNEIEDLPLDQRNAGKAKYLYTLYGEIVDGIHERDRKHPVAIANGDLQYIDLIAKHVPNLDIMGSNVYRGYSSRDLFQDVQNQLGVPFVYTEFGADAYNARENREDHIGQAEYFRTLWQEIYEQSYGKGRVGNAIGGYSFQWSDGWWKYQQEINLDVHDTTASWRNEAYPHDLPADGNNMNEEWFGICAKSRPDEQGYFRLFPRASYYVLRDGYILDPYAADTSLERIRNHWGSLKADEVAVPYEVQKLQDDVKELSLLRVSQLRIELESYYTDGALLDVPGEQEFAINFAPTTNQERQQKRIESLQSFYVGVASNPVRGVEAEAVFNVLGNVPTNPINEIFYENRVFLDEGLLNENDEPVDIPGLERTKVWAAKLTWDEPWFNLEGFYRTGHYHWAYEGDFFGLRPETYFGEAIDIYNADIPVGFEVTGKKGLEGFKLLFGQQVYWGANPLVMGKYQTRIGDYELAIIHQEDISQQQDAATSSVIPQPQSRKTTVYGARQYGPLKFELGGIMAGSPLINEDIQTVEEAPTGAVSYLNSGFFVQDDEIRFIDTLGAKGKVTGTFGQVNAYVQGAYKGLVAGGGPDATLTFTGWSLKESGQGNHWNVLSGLTYLLGNVQIAPNFLFQKPLEEALPNIPGFVDEQTGQFFPGVAPRNIVDDPFAVRGNQELAAYELLIVWDPTPATFFWQFDNRAQEDSPLALGLDLIYRDYRGVQDAGIGVLGDGTQFPFEASVPEEDLFEASIQARGIINGVRYVALLYGGEGQPNGDDERVVERYGLNYEVSYKRLFINGFIRIDDWGPYDFQRDFNLTFPLQTMLDVSYGAVLPRWMYEGYTRFGVRTQWRLLNDFSPRFRVDEANPTQDRLFSNLGDGDNLGYELEVLTYINITL